MPSRVEESVTPQALAAELRFLLGQLVKRFRAGGTLPGPQLSVLVWIVREGPKTASQLAAAEQVRPQSMAHTLAGLDDAGLIVRRRDPDDGRQVFIDLSTKGREVMAAYRSAGEDWAAAAINERLDDEERAVLARAIGLLQRLIEQ